MLKHKFFLYLIAFLIAFVLSSKAQISNPNQYDIIELAKPKKHERQSFLEKGLSKKPAVIILSSAKYNNSNSKSVIIAPVVLKEREGLKGEHILEIKIHNKDYIIFIDKIRSIQKVRLEKVIFLLGGAEQEKVRKSINTLIN